MIYSKLKRNKACKRKCMATTPRCPLRKLTKREYQSGSTYKKFASTLKKTNYVKRTCPLS